MISATVNGVELTIPAIAGNRHYDEIITQGIVIESYVMTTEKTLENRLIDVENLYRQKILVGYLWADCPGGPQTIEMDDKTQRALDKFALRATRSIDQTQNITFR